MSTPTKYEGHTPGPWQQQNKYGVFVLDAVGLVKNTICWTALNNNTRTAENEANARLIADAPTLLAENIRLREALADVKNNWNKWDGDIFEGASIRRFIAEMADTMQSVEAALAPATPTKEPK